MGTVYGATIRSKRNEEGHKNMWRETFGGRSKPALAPTSETSPTPGEKGGKGKMTLVDKQKAKLAKEKQQQKEDKKAAAEANKEKKKTNSLPA